MTRTKLIDRKLPDYTRREENINMISHIAGGVFGIFALVSCIIYAALHGDGYSLAGAIVFGVSTVLLYTISSVYHGLRSETAKKILQIIDHCAVFVMVAGTYTPLMLCGLRKENVVLAWVMFGLVWGVTVLGVVLNSIDLQMFHIFSIVCHLATGWMALAIIAPLTRAIGMTGVLLVVGGGVSYTVGSVLYALGGKKRYFHSIFHFFVIGGSVLQYLGIILYTL